MSPMETRVITSASVSALVASAADEFLAKLDRGESPDPEAFARQFPEIAEVLPQILPVLSMLQEFSPVASSKVTNVMKGGRLGDFQILRELGRGGMGIVYEAEQISLNRRVALKVLPALPGINGKQLARFQIEAQVAAVLNHPHIVPIYAVGCDQGVHFHAMRLIDGPSVAELLRGRGCGAATEDHSPGSTGAIEWRQAARMAKQAAEALEHAHSLGILHRDVKPGNLLLDAAGNLWVGDFGLARLQGVSDLTITGDMLGTLRYMSPEQAAGGRILDPRTDVYALGVTLYEMLVGQPPFDALDRHELLRQIAHDEPAPIRQRNPNVPRDLETIVQKAMTREPSHRYGSAADLAADLDRFLGDRPILARRPTVVERASRWSRKHHRSMVVGGLLLAMLSIALGGGLAVLWKARQHAQSALAEAGEARERERHAHTFTFAASDQVTSRALSMMATTGSKLSQREQEFCRAALEYYSQLSSRYSDDAEMRWVAAAAVHRVGFIRLLLKEPGTDEAYDRSLALYDAILGSPPKDRDLRIDLCVLLTDRAFHHRNSRRLDRAIRDFERLIPILGRLVEDYPESSEHAVFLSCRQGELLQLLEDAGRTTAADALRPVFHQSYLRSLRSQPGNARLWNNLAWDLVSRPGAVPQDIGMALELSREAVARAPEEGNLWNTLGVCCFRSGDFTAAADAFEKSMKYRDGGDPFDWIFLAMVKQQQGFHESALRWFHRVEPWKVVHPAMASNEEIARFQAEAHRLLKPESTALQGGGPALRSLPWLTP